MNQTGKHSDSSKVTGSQESPAPDPNELVAFENAENDLSAKITVDQSPRKPLSMKTLLDRLRDRPDEQPSQEMESGDCQGTAYIDADLGPIAGLEVADNAGAEICDLEKTDSGQRSGSGDIWLGETVASDSTTRPMTFTYTPGSTPLAPYTIRRGIGMGGFGEVYFALSDAGKEVALKRIQRNLEIELRGVSQCLNLKHPNLVALYDICRDAKEQSWVVMEYVPGLNLRQILDESPNGLPVQEVNRWIRGIGAGVHHLHSAGLVHRDIKPGNVFDDLGQVKVGDYGLSKFISTSHRGGHTESVGTFHYMAPEIGRGEYGREIDVYALGVLLFELLTGKVPFDGESCQEIIVKHMTATPDLSQIVEPYRSVISRCLEKDPKKRFASVADMLLALEDDPHENGNAALSFTEDILNADDTASRAPSDQAPSDADPIEAVLVSSLVEPVSVAPDHARTSQPDLFEEPVARALQASWNDLRSWWKRGEKRSEPYATITLLVIVGLIVFTSVGWLVPTLGLMACVYVPYYVIRKMVLLSGREPEHAKTRPVTVQHPSPRRVVSPAAWSQSVRNELRAKSKLSRIAELNTSWIAAILSVAGISTAAGLIGLYREPIYAQSIAHYVWLGITVLTATLAILALGKLWECDEGESLPRRLVLAGVGAGVGFVAYVAGEFLMIPFGANVFRDVSATSLSPNLYMGPVSDSNPADFITIVPTPTLSAFMANFAFSFALLRWWKPVDPLRRKRLSLWSIALAVTVGWGVHQLIPITDALGIMSVGGIAIAVQLSAPWVNRKAMAASDNRAELAGRVTVVPSKGVSCDA